MAQDCAGTRLARILYLDWQVRVKFENLLGLFYSGADQRNFGQKRAMGCAKTVPKHAVAIRKT
jgi:hypothetical protein